GERDPRGLLQVDGDAVFRIVEKREAAAAVVAGAIVLERRILDAKAVGALFRFHVNGAGAEIGQHLADVGAGGIAAEFNPLDPGKARRDGAHASPPAGGLLQGRAGDAAAANSASGW